MRLKLLFTSFLMLMLIACQQGPIALGNEQSIYQPQQQERIITQRDDDASQNRFSGFGNNIFNQFQPAPSNLQQPGFNIFNRFSNFSETKIAILVPLSGEYKALGESMLNAAQLALFFLDEPGLVLMPIDTKGTPFGARKAAEEGIERGAKMILGPIFSRSAKAVAEVAEAHSVSVVSFSNDKTLAGTGVFAIGFRPEQEIERIINYASASGIKDYTAVLPNNNYGATAAEMLRLALQGTESSILRSEIYYVDRNGVAKNLYNHTISAMNAALNNRAERNYIEAEKRYNDEAIVYPRGMLVPEGGARLLKVLDNLEKSGRFDGQKIRLLGSSLWSENMPTHSLLEGAWFAAAPVDRHRIFEMNYEQVYGEKPTSIASLAYDGVALSVALARQSGGQNFSREAISSPRGFMGVDGIFRLEENGLTTRGLAIMEVREGQAVVIDPAPQRFSEVTEHRSLGVMGEDAAEDDGY